MEVVEEKIKFDIQNLFTSPESASLLAKATVTFTTGYVIEGICPFQIALSATEQELEICIENARKMAVQNAQEIYQKTRDL